MTNEACQKVWWAKLWRIELGFVHTGKNKLLWNYSQGLRTCKFHISVLELASLQFLVKEHLACFSTEVMLVLQLEIDHDDDGITCDKYGRDRLGNFFSLGGSLSSGASSLHG